MVLTSTNQTYIKFNNMNRAISIYKILFFLTPVLCFPDPGQWSFGNINVPNAVVGMHKPLYAGFSIHISVKCESNLKDHPKLKLKWVLRQTSCYEDYLAADIQSPEVLHQYFLCPMLSTSFPKIRYFISQPVERECSNRIHLDYVNASFITYTKQVAIPPECETSKFIPADNLQSDVKNTTINNEITDAQKIPIQRNGVLKVSGNQTRIKRAILNASAENISNYSNHLSKPIMVSNGQSYAPFYSNNVKLGSNLTSVDMDGIYLFILTVESVNNELFNLSVDIAMKGPHGYLSAVDYPLLIFYGAMCGLYVLYAIVWLILSALQWRDLLRIQFWIGAVILLGLMEKAVFYAEYQSINYTGLSVQGAILFAEVLSCMKRTLARMLIIIVSLGFGIVKPRLGPTLYRIVGIGALYFCLGTMEGCLRVLKPKTDPGNQALMAGIPLAVTDSVICWWIFSSLVQTTRTLRLRGNVPKLQLYNHFTNALVLSVLASIGFMTWAIHSHKLVTCITLWKELWVDEAYWHFLFSTILFVIMILWRPTNNNQRYAFTPLLDAQDDEEDEEDSLLPSDVFGMKLRTVKNNTSTSPEEELLTKQEDDLKWVEENIPIAVTEVGLPSLLDSDEEIMTAKFMRSKME